MAELLISHDPVPSARSAAHCGCLGDHYVVTLPLRVWRRSLLLAAVMGLFVIVAITAMVGALVLSGPFREDVFDLAIGLRMPVSTGVLKGELDRCHGELRAERKERVRCVTALGVKVALSGRYQMKAKEEVVRSAPNGQFACAGYGRADGGSGR
jgi:hypothetical protein